MIIYLSSIAPNCEPRGVIMSHNIHYFISMYVIVW